MRDIQHIISKIEAELPSDWESLRLLKWQLNRIKSDVTYRAPELIVHDWHDLGNALNSELFQFVMKPDGTRIENPPDWIERIQRILTDTEG